MRPQAIQGKQADSCFLGAAAAGTEAARGVHFQYIAEGVGKKEAGAIVSALHPQDLMSARIPLAATQWEAHIQPRRQGGTPCFCKEGCAHECHRFADALGSGH